MSGQNVEKMLAKAEQGGLEDIEIKISPAMQQNPLESKPAVVDGDSEKLSALPQATSSVPLQPPQSQFPPPTAGTGKQSLPQTLLNNGTHFATCQRKTLMLTTSQCKTMA